MSRTKESVPGHGESRGTQRVPSSAKALVQPGDRSIHPGRVLVPFKDCGRLPGCGLGSVRGTSLQS